MSNIRSFTTRRRLFTESIHEVFKALRDAIILVAIVVLAFLQSWRATLIPLIAVPVAIVGTFAVMLGLGFSLNNLSLFGLVLAIGIVVDDAIVVVEAVEHHLEHGLSPKEAARQGDERSVRADHRHFARVDVRVHAVRVHHRNHRTVLSPVCPDDRGFDILLGRQFTDAQPGALCPAAQSRKHEQRDPLTWLLNLLLGWFFKLFNLGFETSANLYARGVGILLRVSVIVLSCMADFCTSPTSALRTCPRLHSLRKTKAICWSTCGCPTRRRWNERKT